MGSDKHTGIPYDKEEYRVMKSDMERSNSRLKHSEKP
jgi:hypothetical protein